MRPWRQSSARLISSLLSLETASSYVAAPELTLKAGPLLLEGSKDSLCGTGGPNGKV